MADLTNGPAVDTVAMPNSDQAIELVVGPNTVRLTLLFAEQAGAPPTFYMAFIGTNGQQLDVGDRFPVRVNDPFSFAVRLPSRSRDSDIRVYIETDTAPSECKVFSELG